MDQIPLLDIKNKSPSTKHISDLQDRITLNPSSTPWAPSLPKVHHKKHPPRKIYKRICPTCGSEFTTEAFTKVYCNPTCRPSGISQKGQRLSLKDASGGTTGTFSELLVTTDLIANGFFVFRCVSPHAPFDLIAFKDTTLIKIEVKTTTRSLKGVLLIPKHSYNLHDILACVIPSTREIVYTPPLKDFLPSEPYL